MLGDVGNLRPDNQALFIAQVIEILVVLIVGKANGIGAHFQHHGNILFMLPCGQGTAQPLPVLMPGRTTQAVGLAVEQEALLRIKSDAAAAELGFYGIAAVQLAEAGVEIGIFNTVPKVSICNGKGSGGSAALNGDNLGFPVHGNAYRFSRTFHIGFYSDFRVASPKNGSNSDPVSAAASQRKVGGGNGNQLHLPV